MRTAHTHTRAKTHVRKPHTHTHSAVTALGASSDKAHFTFKRCTFINSLARANSTHRVCKYTVYDSTRTTQQTARSIASYANVERTHTQTIDSRSRVHFKRYDALTSRTATRCSQFAICMQQQHLCDYLCNHNAYTRTNSAKGL